MIGKLFDGVFKLSEWLARVVLINLLWMLFSVIGVVVFGFFPSTVAMFSVIRKWFMGEDDLPIFKTFLDYYRKEFVKSNLLGLVLTIIGFIFYEDFHFLTKHPSSIFHILIYPLGILGLVFILVLLYVFPVFVHFNGNLFQVIKNSFFIMVMNPLITIALFIGVSLEVIVMGIYPKLIPFFSGSAFCMLVMFMVFQALIRVETKAKINPQKNNLGNV